MKRKSKEIKVPMKFNFGMKIFETDFDEIKNLENDLEKESLIKKIIQKREYSCLSEKDVEIAFSHFEKRKVSDEEKVKKTRELLHKVFSGFTSRKLLSLKNKESEWILRKHLSTRERLPYYGEVYRRILKNTSDRNLSVIDLGAGANGFSYGFLLDAMNFTSAFPPTHPNYIAVESIGQLVELMNFYFTKNKIKAKAIHVSLFELKKIKELIKKQKRPRIVFLFKVLDSLEMMQKDFSKKLLKEIAPLSERIVVSFATRSMVKKQKFKVKRNWIVNFIKENFEILDDFEVGGERYLIFSKKEKNI